MAGKVRFAVIGTGGIARYHMSGWQRTRLGELVAACDIQPASLKAFGEEFGLADDSLYEDATRLLAETQPDCVSICSWAQHHTAIAIAAAKAGVRGILCEKPLGYSIGEAEKLMDAVDETGAKVMVCHQRRYHRRLTKAARLIAKGALGTVHTMVARGGGGLTNTHSHYIDMMRYMLGDPGTEWVLAQVERSTNRWERCYPVEDRAAVIVSFEGGVRGVIESDMPLEGAAKGGMLVYGTDGMIDLFDGPKMLNASTKGKWRPIEVQEIHPPSCYVRDLVRWLDSGEEPRISLRQAWETHQILMGIYESARLRQAVTFPLKNKRRILQQMIEKGDLKLKKRRAYDIRTPEPFKRGLR